MCRLPSTMQTQGTTFRQPTSMAGDPSGSMSLVSSCSVGSKSALGPFLDVDAGERDLRFTSINSHRQLNRLRPKGVNEPTSSATPGLCPIAGLQVLLAR